MRGGLCCTEIMPNIKEDMWMDSGIEDELSAPSNLFHIAPRNSPAGQASSAGHNPLTHTNVSNLGLLYGDYC